MSRRRLHDPRFMNAAGTPSPQGDVCAIGLAFPPQPLPSGRPVPRDRSPRGRLMGSGALRTIGFLTREGMALCWAGTIGYGPL